MIPIHGHFTEVRRVFNSTLRVVVVDGCDHLVSIEDGVDSRSPILKKRAQWPVACTNYVQFAMREHEIFCRRVS